MKKELEQSDEYIDLDDEPDHDELCKREQQFFLNGILGRTNLTEHQDSAIRASEIVLAADHSLPHWRNGELLKERKTFYFSMSARIASTGAHKRSTICGLVIFCLS